MKPLTLYVSNEVYSSYQDMAERSGVKAAALIRNAMNYYLQENLNKRKNLDSFMPFDSGKMLKDYKDSDFREEMLDDRY